MTYSVHSAYDAASNLRLVRIIGADIPDQVLLGIGRADPTAHLIPTAKNLVDMRQWQYEGSVIEIETQAATLTEIFRSGMGEGYAWVTNPLVHGLTLVFRRHLVERGIGDPRAFTTLEAALEFLGVTIKDYRRAEAALTEISLPD